MVIIINQVPVPASPREVLNSRVPPERGRVWQHLPGPPEGCLATCNEHRITLRHNQAPDDPAQPGRSTHAGDSELLLPEIVSYSCQRW